jgi:predicted small lipoprotein YifL
MLIEIGEFMGRKAEELDRHRASFDKLRMRSFLCATKDSPRPEPVEGRRVVLQWVAITALALSLSACGKKNAPEPPDAKSDQFPRQYPDPSTL